MRLMVGVATLVHPQFLFDCLGSVLDQAGVGQDDVMVVCNGKRVRDACEQFERMGVRVLYPGTNLGTSASWNLLAQRANERGYDGVFVLNDDVRFMAHDCYLHMLAAVEEDPTRFFTTVGIGFSAFAWTRHVWEYARFDEGFWPAYYEDNDFHLRVKKAGITTLDVPLAMEHYGSGSLRMFPEWEAWNGRVAFPVNQKRYVQKWGGLPDGREKFDVPWNGGQGWSAKDMLVSHPERPDW